MQYMIINVIINKSCEAYSARICVTVLSKFWVANSYPTIIHYVNDVALLLLFFTLTRFYALFWCSLC